MVAEQKTQYSLQTILTSATLLLLSWNFMQTWELTVEAARLSERLAAVEVAVLNGVDDRYRSRDADRDFAQRDKALDAMGQAVRDLEAKVDRLELRMSTLGSEL
jgi:cell division protein FtsB